MSNSEQPHEEQRGSVVRITEEREVGVRTKRYFDRVLKRLPPWSIKQGTITISREQATSQSPEVHPFLAPFPASAARLIQLDTLTGEELSPLLESVILTFKRIEDKLADYSGRSYGLFRNIWGIDNSYHQWSYEENQHSDALALILERCGTVSRADLETDYYENLGTLWQPPFETPREMVIYAALQEQLTSLAYAALATRAIQEDAPTVAEIMKLVARDEAYHGGGYRVFTRIFAEIDLDGTIADVEHVARHFRIPVEHLLRNGKKPGIELMRAGAFNKSMLSEGTIYAVLKGLGFMSEQRVRVIADSYWTCRELDVGSGEQHSSSCEVPASAC